MNDLNNNPICLVLASLIADDIAELMDATHDFDHAIGRRLFYSKRGGDQSVPDFVKEMSRKAHTRLIAVEEKLASIGINVQEAHDRLKAKQEAAA